MPDDKDYKEFTDDAAAAVKAWSATLDKIVALLEKAADDADKKKQAQKKAQDDAEKANKELAKKIFDLKIPADPSKANKGTSWLQDRITKDGLKMGDYGSIKPDIDIDTKKMKVKKVGLDWTWSF